MPDPFAKSNVISRAAGPFSKIKPTNFVSMPDPFSCGKFLGVTASDLNPVILGDYKCPRGTRCSFYQDRVLSSTKIIGMNGTIKELAGLDDWHITIEFLFIPSIAVPSISLGLGDSSAGLKGMDALSLDELTDILKVWRKKDSIPVINDFFDSLGIKQIVLTKFEVPTRDRDFELPIRLEALSDEVIDLDKA